VMSGNSTDLDDGDEMLPEYDFTGGVRGKYVERYRAQTSVAVPDPVRMFKVLDTVVLGRDLPEHGLRRGDLGAVVDVHAPDGLDVEFVADSGRTRALLTLRVSDVRARGERDAL
jgi:hypothetical protein